MRRMQNNRINKSLLTHIYIQSMRQITQISKSKYHFKFLTETICCSFDSIMLAIVSIFIKISKLKLIIRYNCNKRHDSVLKLLKI